MTAHPRSRSLALAVAALTLLLCGAGTAPSLAEEATCPCPPPPPPPPLWTGSVGLSYNSTSGNTDTMSLGGVVTVARQPTPWGLEANALVNQAETDGVKSADRVYAGLRGRRALGDRWELFAGLSYEADEFAGFDSREIVAAGGTYNALAGPVHDLAFDAGLTWTTEDPVVGGSDDWLGAVLGVTYAWHISKTATLRERLTGYPNFDTSDDWRVRSETTLEAAIAGSWAVRIGYLFTRDNLPAPGFGKDDGTTSVSVVWKR